MCSTNVALQRTVRRSREEQLGNAALHRRSCRVAFQRRDPYSTVQYCTVMYFLHSSAVLLKSPEHRAVLHSANSHALCCYDSCPEAQCCTAQYYTAHYSTVLSSIVPYCTVMNSAVQHSLGQFCAVAVFTSRCHRCQPPSNNHGSTTSQHHPQRIMVCTLACKRLCRRPNGRSPYDARD